MSWLEKLLPSKIRTSNTEKKGVPEGLWTKCLGCEAVLYRADLERNLEVCPKCGHHHRVGARKRVSQLLDPDGQQDIAANIGPTDHLKFRDSKKYKDRISAMQKSTNEKDALVVVAGQLYNLPVVLAVFEYAFIGGSMGAAVGERFAQAVEASITRGCALVCITASGGARMQEGLVSLLQMAKTSAALTRLAERRLPFVVLLTDPTMGGVSASLAMLGDVIWAEPKALIGFAGPRVIEQTVRQSLPEGFQRSEFLLSHGAIDNIVDRRQLREKLASMLAKLTRQPLPQLNELQSIEPVVDSKVESDSNPPEESEQAPNTDN